ncbi:MAG: threonine/serine exporter family protein [Clostridia bacterium]|nr:threonine/serine exporter family protein [Clostridia bacterium]
MKRDKFSQNIMALENVDVSKYSVEEILSKALDIGENLLKCGGEPHRIEDTIERICYSYGAVATDVFALPSLIIATIRMSDGKSKSQIRRVYKTSNNMYRLEKINDVSRRLCDGKLTLEDVDNEINQIISHKPFSRYIVLLGGVIAAGGFAVFFGGGLTDALVAAVAGLVVSIFNMHKVKFSSNFFYVALVSFFGALVGIGLHKLGVGENLDMIMIGTIMLVIPGLAFGNAVRDLLFGDTVSGIIQLVQAILLAVMVAFGFIAAIIVFGGVLN